nr:hypothetical protein [Selenomonadaceae bacterium]
FFDCQRKAGCRVYAAAGKDYRFQTVSSLLPEPMKNEFFIASFGCFVNNDIYSLFKKFFLPVKIFSFFPIYK